MSRLTPNTVGLFGTGGASTWRASLKALFAERGIDCYDPQVDGWTPDLADEEAWHLANDKVILFTVTGETFGFGSLVETGFSVLPVLSQESTRCVLLYIAPEVDDSLALASPEQAEASRRARSLVLAHLRQFSHPRVYLTDSLDDLRAQALHLCTELYWQVESSDEFAEGASTDPRHQSAQPYSFTESPMHETSEVVQAEAQDEDSDDTGAVLYGAGLSWWSFFIKLSIASAFVVSGAAAVHYGGDSFIRHLGWLALPGLLAIPGLVMKKQSITAYVTARHVVVKDQLISLHTTTLNLNRVESVDIHQTFMQRILGYGTVVVRGLGSEDLELRGLARPAQFKQAVLANRGNTAL